MKSIVLAIVLIAILVTGNALPALAVESAAPQVFLAETVTSSAVVTLTGIAPAGNFVEIFRNNRSLGITVANDQGSFSLVTYIDEGINAFQARLVSSDGSTGAFSDTVFVTLDLVSPLPPVPDTVAAILEPTQFLFGSAESGAGVGVLLDGKLVETVPVNEQGRWQTSNLNLATGWHDFLFFAVDQAGNQSIYSPLVKTLVGEISPDVRAALTPLAGIGHRPRLRRRQLPSPKLHYAGGICHIPGPDASASQRCISRHHRSVLSGSARRLLGAGSHRQGGSQQLDERLFGRVLPS